MQNKYFPRLKDLREDKDKNQDEIAKVIGTSQSYYAQYENGKRSIPFERVIDIAKYYNVSLDYIAGITNDKKGIGFKEEINNNKYEKGLNKIIQVAEDLKKIK